MVKLHGTRCMAAPSLGILNKMGNHKISEEIPFLWWIIIYNGFMTIPQYGLKQIQLFVVGYIDRMSPENPMNSLFCLVKSNSCPFYISDLPGPQRQLLHKDPDHSLRRWDMLGRRKKQWDVGVGIWSHCFTVELLAIIKWRFPKSCGCAQRHPVVMTMT